jgi:cytochrome c biogenesis protein CcmG/thiol:disulfide interchange protein DsbE
MEPKEKLPEDLSPEERAAEEETGGRRRRVRKRRVVTFLMVSIVSVALLALLGSQLLVAAPDQGQASSSGNSDRSPLIGHPAPDFTLASLSTHSASAVHLASFKGRPLMLNFWASWCDPCKREAPLLEATWQRVQGQGVVFLGIDFEDAKGDALNFLQTYGITYPNVIDAGGSVAISYGVSGVPETFFIDRHGVIVHKVIGELTEQTLQSNLQVLVGEAFP